MDSLKSPTPVSKRTRHSAVLAPLPRKKHHCIVIGGGLAGLAAGYRLARRGWRVDVFEAHRRLRGRVFSYRFPQARNLICELGGEWIGDDHDAMKRLAREFGLELQSHQYSYFFWNVNSRSRRYRPGEDCFSDKAHKGFQQFAAEFKTYNEGEKRRLDKLDWWTCLRQRKFSHRELLKRDLMDSTDFGESIRQTSAYTVATEYFGGNATDEMDWKIAGGNSRLIHALARNIGSVRTRAEVKLVRQRGEEVTVALANGEKFRADVCICAVPAPCLRNIEWDPPLSPKQSGAADQLQYSRIMKSAVLYRARFWPEHKDGGFSVFTSRVSDFCFDSTYLQKGDARILCSYAIGEKADDLAAEPNKNDVAKWLTEDILHAIGRPKTPATHPVAIRTQAWQNQNWIGGAYALYRPGCGSASAPFCKNPTVGCCLPASISPNGRVSWKEQSTPAKPPLNCCVNRPELAHEVTGSAAFDLVPSEDGSVIQCHSGSGVQRCRVAN
jgi:monoamine oxidase